MFGENCPKCGKIEIVGYTCEREHGKRIYGCDCGVYYEERAIEGQKVQTKRVSPAVCLGCSLPSAGYEPGD